MAVHVLIAEDEPHIVESLEFILSRAGYEVSTVSDGRAALEQVRRDRPQVLVLDVMLPGCDGFEVLQQLRADPVLATTRVLILTAKGQDRDRQTARALGVDAFMTKPFSNRDLVDCVRQLAAP